MKHVGSRHACSSRMRAGAVLGLAASLATGFAGAAGAQVLPPSPDPTCTVAPADFKGWFTAQPGSNQPVNPANSLQLDTSNNCNFYKWSAQMFLWLTSPGAGALHDKRVFRSETFYRVDQDKLVKQDGLLSRNLTLSATKFGPDGLPFVLDDKGRLREFVTAPGRAGLTAGSAPGSEGAAEIASVRPGANGRAEFLDAEGKPVTAFTPTVTAGMLPQRLGRLVGLAAPGPTDRALSATDERQRIAAALTAKKILIRVATRTGPVFVEAGSGEIVNLSPGQAGRHHGVLVSQQNATVYYEVLVNDVYAWYLTGRKTPNGIAPTYDGADPTTFGLFPTGPSDLAAVVDFARSHGGPSSFADGNALAVEVKLSWVEAATLPDQAQGYITAEAEVPVYDTGNPADWVPNGSKRAKVALVGAHVVGSTKGHPEMVWATFEHQANAPLAAYTYTSGGQQKLVPSNPTGPWTFSASGPQANYNALLAEYITQAGLQQGHIVSTASPPVAIVPNNVLRQKAWGVASDGTPNQQDATPAIAATQVISLNTDVRAKLAAAGAQADPRFNYLLIGATWTMNGGEPVGPFPTGGNEIGTSMLTNSTMETFMQGTDTTFATGTNCFACHTSSGTNPKVQANTSVSHFFDSIAPLSLTARKPEK